MAVIREKGSVSSPFASPHSCKEEQINILTTYLMHNAQEKNNFLNYTFFLALTAVLCETIMASVQINHANSLVWNTGTEDNLGT